MSQSDRINPLNTLTEHYDGKKPARPDYVNHPPHYKTDSIECIDAIRAALGLDGFVSHCRGTAIKYAWRAGKKGATAEDLRKGAWYLNKAAEALDTAAGVRCDAA